jgi:hypothetical protein
VPLAGSKGLYGLAADNFPIQNRFELFFCFSGTFPSLKNKKTAGRKATSRRY